MPRQQYTEEQLVAILYEGKPEQFGVLYDYFSPALYGIVSKIIGNDEHAQDILQESFVKIWEKSRNYDSTKGRLFTWMLNIARNTAIDASRSKHVKVAAKIQNAEIDVPSATSMADVTCKLADTRVQPNNMMPRNEASRKNAVNTS